MFKAKKRLQEPYDSTARWQAQDQKSRNPLDPETLINILVYIYIYPLNGDVMDSNGIEGIRLWYFKISDR